MLRPLSPKFAGIILSQTRDGIMITNADNEIVYVNEAFSEITGYAFGEVIGCNPDILNSSLHNGEFFKSMWESLNRQGHWQGEIWDKRKNGEPFLQFLSISAIKNDKNEVENYIGILTDINEQHKAEKLLDRVSHYDPLTKLANRNHVIQYLNTHLNKSGRSPQLIAVLVLDLDDFKPFNDKYGHNLGDRLLIVVAKKLQRLVRSTDLVGRTGGDEFSLILSNLHSIDELELMANRILELVTSPITVDGQTYQLSTSIGSTVYPFDDSESELLLRHADQAMYRAKNNGKNQHHLFDIGKDQQAQTRREIIQQLAKGLENDELVLYYQPKVNMRTGKIVGVEALIRWQHPQNGLLGPGAFLPLVEYHDIIIQIGEWVIYQALTQLRYWLSQNLRLSISVNIAAKQILRSDFVHSLKQIVNEFPDIPLELLELEILESAALESTKHVAVMIEQCQQLGIRFALDDFGTGYASLSYLRDIPADVLKIDRSFIANLLENRKDLALVEGIISLATVFQRSVIAEGIEATEQGVLLMRLGCDLGQGFGIAKPMPAEEILNWAANYQPQQEWSIWADTSWEMNDFPLLVAQHDHVNWVKKILLYVEGGQDKWNDISLTNHHECRFGHWYYHYGKKRYQHLQSFLDIEPLHILVHQLGCEIINIYDAGNIKLAHNKIPELLHLKDQVLDKLADLQQKIVISTKSEE